MSTQRGYPPSAQSPHRRATTPCEPNRLMQKVGWLLPLVPKAVVLRAQRENLLRDAEMAELIQSVPARARPATAPRRKPSEWQDGRLPK